MAEQVTIKINVKADTAAIERLRAQLKSLCREADDCSDTFDKYSKGLDTTSTNQKKLTETTEGHSKAVRRLSGSQKANNKDNDSFIKQLFKMDDVGKKLLGGLGSLAKLGFKYVAIEAAAAAAVIGSAGLLFKAGQLFAKGYQAALAGVSYALTAVVAAGAAFLAVQQQFASVQFAPMFQKGLINTEDRFEAADLAMRGFVNASELSVFGTKALTASFAEMAKKVDPSKLGMATGAMRELGNVAAGMGGDIGKNFQDVSKFVADFAKEGKLTDAVKKQGENISPIFKKVIEEQSKAGNTTFEKFMGGLKDNKTFQDAYGGQLDAVNNTVMGRIKGAFTDIKAMLTDMGGPMLNPLGDAVTKIKHMIEALLMRVRGTVTEVGSGSLIDGLVKGIEKVTLLMGRLMTHDVGKAGAAFEQIKNAWNTITGFFEKIQDYLRPLQDAAMVLYDALKPVFSAFAGNFNSTIQTLSKSLVDNKENIVGFTTEIGRFLKSFGNFGQVLKDAFIKALPVLKQLASALAVIFDMLTKVFGTINKLGGHIGGLATLLAGFLGMRALKIGAKGIGNKINSGIAGKMGMGGNMPGMGGAVGQNVATMNVTAGVVNMSGGMGVTGRSPLNPQGGIGSTPYGPMMPAGQGAAGMGRMASMGARAKAIMGGGPLGMGKSMGLMGVGMGVNALNDQYLGGNQYVGAAGSMAQTAGMIGMMGGSAGMAGVGAIGVGAYKVGGALSEKAFGNNDSIAGKAGGALVGAAGGAAVGAAVGSVVPVIGTAAGAVVGAIVGGVSGWLSAGKNKKKARKAADEFTSGFSSAVEQAFKDGDVAALQELKDSYVEQAAAAAKGNIDVYNEKIAEFAPELEKINARIDTFSSNAETMSRYLGLTTDDMNAITEKTGINFQNRVVDIFEVIGRAGEEFGLNLKDVLGNILGDIDQKQTSMLLDLMDAPGQMREAGVQLDAAQSTLMSGDTSAGAQEEYIKAQFAYSSAQAGGDPMKALQLTTDFIKAQGGAGGALEGKSEMLMGTISSMGLLDPQNLVNIAKESGQIDLMSNTMATASGDTSPEAIAKAKEILLNQIATGGVAAFTQQEELMKSYALTGTGASGGVSKEQFLLGAYGNAAGLATGANQALLAQPGALGTYGGGGVNLAPPPVAGMNPSTLGAGTVAPNGTTQTINVGETKVQVSGILSPAEAQQIANAIIKSQGNIGERLGAAAGMYAGKTLPASGGQ